MTVIAGRLSFFVLDLGEIEKLLHRLTEALGI